MAYECCVSLEGRMHRQLTEYEFCELDLIDESSNFIKVILKLQVHMLTYTYTYTYSYTYMFETGIKPFLTLFDHQMTL